MMACVNAYKHQAAIYRDSLLHSWYRSRGLAEKWFLFLAWQAAPLLFFWKYRRSNSWIQFSPNPVHHAPEWPRGGAVSWCWWQCNVCRAHCSALNLWLSGSFTQIIGPVHKTWFMEAYWRSELYPIVQHLLILLSHSRHETWGLFIIDGSTNVASGLENWLERIRIGYTWEGYSATVLRPLVKAPRIHHQVQFSQ